MENQILQTGIGVLYQMGLSVGSGDVCGQSQGIEISDEKARSGPACTRDEEMICHACLVLSGKQIHPALGGKQLQVVKFVDREKARFLGMGTPLAGRLFGAAAGMANRNPRLNRY